ncbi:MAG: peptide chain release factor 3 [Acetilactobacillus jinshanensis]
MKEPSLSSSINKRRTFAIISHPDAGKTTITEHLLLFGGVVHQAGSVKARKTGHYAKSDWMPIEKKRGISVTSSVMQFDYGGKRINLLDTPGHQDFSEDTYRTLMAVDSAVMVIDSAKGIEAQTKKLFKICSMRGIPIFTFMNKIDRDTRDPMDLIGQLEDVLGIEAYPMNWPIGSGRILQGLYDRYNHRLTTYGNRAKDRTYIPFDKNGDPVKPTPVTKTGMYKEAKASMQLINEAGNQFSEDKILHGKQTPVFFGSALKDFGVKTFLDGYLDFAPKPEPHEALVNSKRTKVIPTDPQFTGFVFKIQANLNPRHRDRIAFVRICSGKFVKGMTVTLHRTHRQMRLNNVTEFIANNRENVNLAVAGDIIGLYDTGNFQIGDTIYSGKKDVKFPKLPQFTPELFAKVSAKNVMKQKTFYKGIHQLVQEGAVQLFREYSTNAYILGAVGDLQFQVFQFRMENEYHSDINLQRMGHKTARWVDPKQINDRMSSSRNLLVKDQKGHPLFLFDNDFAMRWFQNKYPDVKLTSKL